MIQGEMHDIQKHHGSSWSCFAFAGLAIPVANCGKQRFRPRKVVQLTRLAASKDNAKEPLSVESGKLAFVHGKNKPRM